MTQRGPEAATKGEEDGTTDSTDNTDKNEDRRKSKRGLPRSSLFRPSFIFFGLHQCSVSSGVPLPFLTGEMLSRASGDQSRRGENTGRVVDRAGGSPRKWQAAFQPADGSGT